MFLYVGRGEGMGFTKDNIDQSWWSQYEPNDRVYTGSKNDGTGDPHAARLRARLGRKETGKDFEKQNGHVSGSNIGP